jgi:hypothetical protein
MNKGAIIGVVIVLTSISFAAGFFVDRQLHADEKGADSPEVLKLKADLDTARAQRDDFAQENNPKLWLDQDAGEVVRHLGCDYVYLVRWRNGILDGWVEFDEADGPKQFPLDHSRQAFDRSSKAGRKPVAKGSKGNILVSLRQIGKSDEFDCEVIGDFTVWHEGGSGGGQTYSKKGKVKLENYPAEDKFFGGGFRFGKWHRDGGQLTVERCVNKTALPWVSVKLVEVPK